MATHISIHAPITGAKAQGTLGAPLLIETRGQDQVVVFIDDRPLAIDLAAAINDVLRKHASKAGPLPAPAAGSGGAWTKRPVGSEHGKSCRDPEQPTDELRRELEWRQAGQRPRMIALATDEIERILQALAEASAREIARLAREPG